MKLSTLKRKTVVWKDSEYPPSELAAEWLPKLEKAFQKYQSTRDRLAVYPYLTAIYRFRTHFKPARDARAVGAEMIAQKGLSASRSDDPFNLIIRATATVNVQNNVPTSVLTRAAEVGTRRANAPATLAHTAFMMDDLGEVGRSRYQPPLRVFFEIASERARGRFTSSRQRTLAACERAAPSVV